MMNGLGEKRFRAFSPSSYSKHKQAVEAPDYAGSFYMKNLFYDGCFVEKYLFFSLLYYVDFLVGFKLFKKPVK